MDGIRFWVKVGVEFRNRVRIRFKMKIKFWFRYHRQVMIILFHLQFSCIEKLYL